MKTLNFLLIIILATTLFSCGKSENKVKSGTYSSGVNRNPITDYGTPEQQNYMSQVRSRFSCKNGESRMSDVTFSTTNIISQSAISGEPMNNSVISGSVAQVYAGGSDYGDIMFVSKMTDGSSTLGFNVTLSFCSHGNLLHPQRSIMQFNAHHISFVDSTICDMPTIKSAQSTRAVMDAFTIDYNGIQTQRPAGEVAMTTFNPYCY